MKKYLALSLHLLITSFLFAQTLPDYLPADGLVGWWPFNGNANDESGNGNDGTVNGAILSNDRFGNINCAFGFENSYIDFGNSSSLDITPEGFTISIWAKNNADAIGSHILGKRIACSDPDFQYQIAQAGDPEGLVWGGKTPDETSVINSGIILPALQWQHIVGIFDGTQWGLYVNGNLISTLISAVTDIVNAPLLIGNSGSCSYYSGFLDDLAIYNRALTQEEITALYTGTPINGGGNTSSHVVPLGIPYQAVIRNANGQVAANTAVTTRFTLHQNTTDGAVEYQETHGLTTNEFGLINTVFGSGSPVIGTFDNINWSNTNKFIQIDADLGSGYIEMGTQQLMSVPYSIQSQTATTINNTGLPIYANNAAALAGGLTSGQLYRTATGDLKIVY